MIFVHTYLLYNKPRCADKLNDDDVLCCIGREILPDSVALLHAGLVERMTNKILMDF